MPMTVITLSNAPPSLKGDLTKWMQEIATGVYIGNFNSKIREHLWERVKRDIHRGQATLSYRHRNELGYLFETHQTHRRTIDCDGIQLVIFPPGQDETDMNLSDGFSKASQFRKAKKFSKITREQKCENKNFVVLDIETDGLDKNLNHIIEIGAIKIINNEIETLELLINTQKSVPQSISQLTGITESLLASKGVMISQALEELTAFIDNLIIVGYSIDFDIDFINHALAQHGKKPLANKSCDLLRFIKKDKMFLDNYRLTTVLPEYEIDTKVPHRALADAELILELSMKVNGFLDFLNKRP